jgi:hypothetical protein
MRVWRCQIKSRFAAGRVIVPLLVACVGAGGTLSAGAAAIISIDRITGGQTIDFDSPGDPNSLFASHQMQLQAGLVGNGPSGGFDPWVTGNLTAPAGGGNVFGTFRVRTTGAPWSAIGASAAYPTISAGVDQPSADFRIRVFDQGGSEIGSLTRTFHASPEDDSVDEIHRAYNAAVAFLGFASATPIYAVEFSRADGQTNVYWDNLTFAQAPEPSSLAIAGAMLGASAARRGRPRRGNALGGAASLA